eukprot:6964379-Lingulodinium_polyedra.AAC.1
MVVDISKLQRIFNLFDEYGRFPNLKLNWAKVVVMPLCSQGCKEAAKRRVAEVLDVGVGGR